MKWDEKAYVQYMQKLGNRVADSITDMESNSCNASNDTQIFAGYDTPCSIHIKSIRNRLADPDGISGKACIDGLVHAKILKDDSARYVKEVSYSQEKGIIEKTVIILTF